MSSASYTGQAQQTTAGLVGAMSADASWCPAVSTCVVPSADTIQQVNSSAAVTAWNSLVEIGATPLTANITITLPSTTGDIGKTITFKRLDAAAFTVTLAPFAGDTGEVTTPTVLNSQYGALTLEAVSATKYEQVSNISAPVVVAPTTNTLVAAAATITSTVDGVVATITPATGVIQANLGFSAAGALVKAVPAATTNTLVAASSVITSTVDGVVAAITPAVGNIQNTLGFDATGALVKAVVPTTGILVVDGVQTNNRIQNLGTFSQTWNNVGGFTKNIITGAEVSNFSDTFTPSTGQVAFTPDSHNLLSSDGMGSNSALTITPTLSKLEVNAGGVNRASFSVEDGTVGAAAADPQLFLKTNAVYAGTALAGQVLTLTAATGEAEFKVPAVAAFTTYTFTTTGVVPGLDALVFANPSAPITLYLPVSAIADITKTVQVKNIGTSTVTLEPTGTDTLDQVVVLLPGEAKTVKVRQAGAYIVVSEFSLATSSDTVQTANVTGTTTITAWGSVVMVPTLTGNATLLYPTPVGNIGKTIKVIQTGVPNAFTLTHTPAVGTITFTNTAGELADANGAFTLEAIDATSVRQVSNSVADSTVSALTYGRVNAVADLANTSFSITAPGTKVPFDTAVYSSGMTVSGTSAFIPSVSGRYRGSWLMMAPSGQFNGDGFFHIVQGGVSLGSIYIDLMEAAGVNQTFSFIDVDVVAGTAVELRYEPDTADSIVWGRGSYFDLSQLPTAVAPVINTVAEYVVPQYAAAGVTPTGSQNTSANAAQFMAISIPSAGTWDIEWSVLGQVWQGNGGGTNDGIASGLYDSAGVFIANTELASAAIASAGSTTGSNLYVQGTRSTTLTTVGATTFNVKVWNPNGLTRATAGSGVQGRSYVKANKLAGQLPSTGSTVAYAYARLTSNAAIANAAADLVLNANLQGNIPNASGVFTLSAGNTYTISGNFIGVTFDQATTQGVVRFVDSANTQVTGSPSIVLRPSTDTTLNGTSPGFEFVFTPTVTGSYKFRVDAAGVGRSLQIGQSETSVSIRQLGSTSNTVGTLPALDQSAAGYFDIGNMRMQWGSHDDGNVDTTTVTLPVAFANVNYVVTCTSNNGVAGSTSIEAKTTTTFDIDRASTTVSTNIWGWIAIGMKP